MRLHSVTSWLLLAAADVIALSLCAVVACWIKSLGDPALPLSMYFRALPVLLVGAILVYASLGSYPGIGKGPADELRSVVLGTTIFAFGIVTVTFLGKQGGEWSRQVVLTTWLLAIGAVPLARNAVRRTRWWGVPVVVLGAGTTGAHIVRMLRQRPWLGLQPVSMLDDDASKHGQEVEGVRVVGGIEALPREASRGVRHGILAMPGLPAQRLSTLLDTAGDCLRHVFIAPALPGSPDVIALTREFANTMVLEVQQNLLLPEARALKRCLDVISVVAIVMIFWWLLLAIILAVKMTSAGPIFYGQRRIGRGGASFVAWKFRSMVKNAEGLLHNYLAEHPELREEWERDHKLRNDPRVTMIGRFLRRTSLDELPQLWNVLRGEMSLVGPRPIVADEIEKYGVRFPLYTKVSPGLSGLWQVSGRNDTTYAERVGLDCYYVRNWSVWLDLVILARTVRVVVCGKGAY